MSSLPPFHRHTTFTLLFLFLIITSIGPVFADEQLLANLPADGIDFNSQVKPVLERRCVVCHGCYDAPCQLKLSSIEGLQRGASKEKVYDGTRISGAEPTRLGIDATSAAEWRKKEFFPVVSDTPGSPRENLEQSTLYKLLQLKQQHPQPGSGRLPKDFDLGLDRDQVCAKGDEFEKYARKHPLWGMPYAMPNLGDKEYTSLSQWVALGTPAPPPPAISATARQQITDWEAFLNGSDNKQKLVSRYLYEHLFQAHLHFSNSPAREFFRLVRSSTPPGKPVAEIPTLRPYDDPGKTPFFYRLRAYHASIVAKNHVVYELSPHKLARFNQLFLQPEYKVDTLPSYNPEITANPFDVYAAIPPVSRYRFLLDDARFFIEGFIKGPVCRGQIALNVIEDNFWVVFFSPDSDLVTLNPAFLKKVAPYLQIPSEDGNTFRMFGAWTKYWYLLTDYMNAKEKYFAQLPDQTLTQAMDFIWDGDDSNPNAALTIFRHFDSASVEHGLLGNYPETAWILDYPTFERIHYLLVAGFNVYGNVGHQLNTRLYMDFLRMEGEDHFLAFLPSKRRKQIRDSWYAGLRSNLQTHLDEPNEWLKVDKVSGYRTYDVQNELYKAIISHLGPDISTIDYINRCPTEPCQYPQDDKGTLAAERNLAHIAKITGADLTNVPDLSFLRVRQSDASKPDLAFTLILNKAYKNITSMFSGNDDDRRDIDNYTLTILKGLHGSYPNFFFDIELSDLAAFAKKYSAIHSEADHQDFVEQYGVRRTNPSFWLLADWFQDYYATSEPELSGLFDLNRYHNR